VEFGDFFEGADQLDRLRTRTYSESLEKTGYDAICVMPSSFALGGGFLKEIVETSSVPFVCLNIKEKTTGEFLDRSFVVKDVGNLRIAIIGLTDTQVALQSRNQTPGPHHSGGTQDTPKQILQDLSELNLDLLDPQKSLREYLPFITSQADLIVILSSLAQHQNEEIANRFPAIDIIIGTNSEVGEKLVNSTVILNNTSSEGKKIGRLILTVSDERKLVEHKIDWLSVEKKYSEDAEVRELLNDFYQTVAGDETLWGGVQPKPASFDLEKDQTNKYVGAFTCRACHKEIYTAWGKTKHANAYNTLVKKNRYFYPDCVSCHTTGAGSSSGFKIGRTTKHLEGVQCEVCHGPGKKHVASKGTLKLRETIGVELCVECHASDVSPEFEGHFAHLLEKVDHSQVPENLRFKRETATETKARRFPNLMRLRKENPELFMRLYENLSARCRSGHLLFECKGRTAAEMKEHLDHLVGTDNDFDSLMIKMVEEYGESVRSNEHQKANFRLKQQSVVDAISEILTDKETVSLDLFVMSYCPYGIQAEKLLYELEDELFKGRIGLRLHFIASEIEEDAGAMADEDNEKSGAFKSLHGQKEVDENMRQALIQKYHPDKLKQYLLLRNTSISSTDWRVCARSAGIVAAEIEQKIENGEGAEVLAENVKSANSKRITASPTLLIDGRRFLGRFKRGESLTSPFPSIWRWVVVLSWEEWRLGGRSLSRQVLTFQRVSAHPASCRNLQAGVL